jgi:hypothetical protein
LLKISHHRPVDQLLDQAAQAIGGKLGEELSDAANMVRAGGVQAIPTEAGLLLSPEDNMRIDFLEASTDDGFPYNGRIPVSTSTEDDDSMDVYGSRIGRYVISMPPDAPIDVGKMSADLGIPYPIVLAFLKAAETEIGKTNNA